MRLQYSSIKGVNPLYPHFCEELESYYIILCPGVYYTMARKKLNGAQKAGLAKGQSRMARAAAAYRAGRYPNMRVALKNVA